MATLCSASIRWAALASGQSAVQRQSAKGHGLSTGRLRNSLALSVHRQRTVKSRALRIDASAVDDGDLDR